jgi:asparagine synthetase B (glutamine-hydrolysing)
MNQKSFLRSTWDFMGIPFRLVLFDQKWLPKFGWTTLEEERLNALLPYVKGYLLDIVEFAASVPPKLKLKHLRHKKYLLKSSMRGKLPDQILGRKKQGFNVPNARWIKKDLKPFITDCLSPKRIREIGVFDTKAVENLLHEHFEEKVDNSHQVWCILTLSLWSQQFSEGRLY